MATAIKMPQLGVTMTEAKVVRWLKAIGETVQVGEPLAEIETDKISAEVPATAGGVLRRIVADEGATVPVTGLLGVIAAADEPESAVNAALGGPQKPPLPQATAAPASPSPVPFSPGAVRASPLAKRLARERGLDLRAIRGTGPGGRVLERDVLAAPPAPAIPGPRPPVPVPASDGQPGPAAAGRRIPFGGMRRRIAERMLQSMRGSAQLTLTAEADATALVALREHLLPAARVYGHRPPTYTDMLVYLVARVLPQHPLLNSSLTGDGDGQEIVCWADVNVGVAVAVEQGLVVPVLRQADRKALDATSAELGALAERARSNTLTVDDLRDGTFTITNLGALEIDAFTPILNPPQCAILGVGRIAKKPAVVDDQVVGRHLLTLSLTFDHRIVDGAPAAAFLRDLKRAIEGVSGDSWGAGAA